MTPDPSQEQVGWADALWGVAWLLAVSGLLAWLLVMAEGRL
jgi:hypothetical protein